MAKRERTTKAAKVEAKPRYVEARVGFEPTNGGFADLSLGPLGYRAEFFSIAKSVASVRAARRSKSAQDFDLTRN